MTANMSVCKTSNLNDARTQSLQNTKTVECQLGLTLEKLAATEGNIELFGNLLKLGVATNEVKSFILKQSIHKKVSTKPDFKVQKAIIKSKLQDA